MRGVSFGAYQSVIGVAYLGLMTNVMVAVGNLPLVVLLLTTDPAVTWPLMAATAPLSAPAVVAAFTVFRAHREGSVAVVRVFLAAYRSVGRRALGLGVIITSTVVVALVDVRFFSDSPLGVVFIPFLGVLTVLVLAIGLVALAAVAEAPAARLRDILRASAYLALRRWYLTVGSLVVLGAYVALFVSMPAIALGVATAPALYLAWANCRHTLLPVLEVSETPASDAY